MTQNEYESNELARFQNQENGFFDTVADFEQGLDAEWLSEQIKWIEGGNYGAGATLALRRSIKSTRGNPKARAGAVIIKALFGKTLEWPMLSEPIQAIFDKCVIEWMNQEHEFAI